MITPKYIKVSAVRKAIKEHGNKQVSKEALMMIDDCVGRIIYRSLQATKQFKRLTEQEVRFVTTSLFI